MLRLNYWRRLAINLYTEIKSDDIVGGAGELAFRLFLALFPFFVFVASLGAFIADQLEVEDPTAEIMDLIGDSLPEDLSSVLRNELAEVLNSSDTRLISIGIGASVLASASAIQTIIKTMNRVFNVVETRPFLLRYVLSIALTFLGGTLLVLAFIVFLVGQVYGLEIAREIGIEGQAAEIINFLRWPATITAVLLAVDFLYWFTPNIQHRYQLFSVGSVVFTIAWTAATFLFGLYVENFGSYNATYGTLGAVVVLLLWFYLTSFILFAGAELNAVLAGLRQEEQLRAGQPQVAMGQLDAEA